MSTPPPPTFVKKSRRRKRVTGGKIEESVALEKRYLLLRNILIVIALPTLIVAFFVGRWLLVERRSVTMSRPRIIHPRPPELLQPIACDLAAGLHSGSLRTFVRNVENGEPGLVLQTLALHLVPERKVGMPEFDEIPSGDCGAKPRGGAPTTLLSGGRVTPMELPEPKVLLPPLLKGEPAQIYALSCVNYLDAGGNDHTTCDTYRLRQPGGSPLFICDATPKTGTFDETPVSSCGN